MEYSETKKSSLELERFGPIDKKGQNWHQSQDIGIAAVREKGPART